MTHWKDRNGTVLEGSEGSRAAAGELLKALLASIRDESASPVRKAYAAAVGCLLQVAAAKRAQWVISQTVEMHQTGARASRTGCL